jgi:hypothetical protein
MIGQIVRREDNIKIITENSFAGNAFQGDFRVGGSTGAERKKQKDQDRQEKFPHGITVFL